MKKYTLTLILALVKPRTVCTDKQKQNNHQCSIAWLGVRNQSGSQPRRYRPIPFPEEIRSIDGYNPTLIYHYRGKHDQVAGVKKKWGIITGLRLENKGMRTKATVKNYNMEIIGYDGNRLKGNWTGGVRTKVQNSYITMPVLAAYKLNPRTTLKLGPYFSYLMERISAVMYTKAICAKTILPETKSISGTEL